MNNKCNYIAIFLVCLFPAIRAQLPHGGKPFPYSAQKSAREQIIPGDFDIQKAINESLSEEAVSGKRPFKFAYNYSLHLSPLNSGDWSIMKDGTNVWRIHLSSPGAFSVNIDFSEFQLKPGSRVFIYPPSQDHFLGGFNHQNNKDSNSLPISFIKGEELVVELQVPAGISDFGSLVIGSMGHAFIDVFGHKEGNSDFSGACNVDINCPEGENWQIIKKAVCKISFKSGSSTELCSGALINNTRFDTIPYLLTANHCIRFAAQAASAVFYFDYEADTCNRKTVSGGYTLSGSSLLATSDSIDFSLLRLSENPPAEYEPYFAGWSLSETPANSAVCIHHPLGDIKKISIENEPLSAEYQDPIPPSLDWLTKESIPAAFWRVKAWDAGTTEGGSSGAPLFNQNKMIVGNLTGGEASCVNPVNDYFSKIHVGWDHYDLYTKQLKHWLDPDGTGITNLIGFNPFGVPDTSTIDTIETGPRFSVFPNPASGLVTFETDSLDISGGILSLYSLTGKEMTRYIVSDPVRLTFNVSFLNPGLYILEFRKGTIHERKRLVVIYPKKL